LGCTSVEVSLVSLVLCDENSISMGDKLIAGQIPFEVPFVELLLSDEDSKVLFESVGIAPLGEKFPFFL
jgi:hypothetical protein